MTGPDRRRKIEEICDAALNLRVDERDAFIASRSDGDEGLRSEVNALLAHARTADRFFDRGIDHVAARLLGATRTSLVGSQLGAYRILSELGAGGMGEVYRARDTQLGRDVAIKILPAHFAADLDRIARFDREARVLAALNHPNIAAIYGVERSGHVQALVLELVEGETLAERIARGALSAANALAIAGQIAEALEAANEKGIVHRDLKPANIKITADGTVKVLDFGLAAATAGGAAHLSRSPTLTLGGTQRGVLLGTAAYMSPEQARGQTADRRADIWAFGCVFYEMLTGRMAFPGATVSDQLAAILERDPDWTIVPASVPAVVPRVLRGCFEKDRGRRWRDIGDVRLQLATPDIDGLVNESRSRRGVTGWIGAALAALGLIVALGAVAFTFFRETPRAQHSLRFQIAPPGSAQAAFLSLSPDGHKLAFVTNNGGTSQLWVRSMDMLESRALSGTDGATFPFWSPDSASLGFFAQGKLKKIAAVGGLAQALCDAPNSRGGTWNREGVILFTARPTSAIFRIPAAGGVPAPVTKVAENGFVAGHRFPAFLPDGVHFLFLLVSDKPEKAGIYVGSLNGAAAVRLLPDRTKALYAPPATSGASGRLLFRREATLMAVPFDPTALNVSGETVPIAERVPLNGPVGFGAFSVSENGTLVYRSGYVTFSRELLWVDRTGKRLTPGGNTGHLPTVRFSETPDPFALAPDEKTVAVEISNGPSEEIWLHDMTRNVMSRFTFRPDLNREPVWSPDGSRLAFLFQASGTYYFDIYQKPASGNGPEEFLVRTTLGSPNDWSPDGKWIVYGQLGEKTGADLWLLPMDGERKPVPYLQTPFDQINARFSPDGKWMAYQSDESGQFEVYVQAVPPSGAKWQISTMGGQQPRWRRDGKELFFISADQKLMATPIKLSSTVEPSAPQPLFPVIMSTQISGQIGYGVEPSRDGQRFLVMRSADGETTTTGQPITVVTNWQTAELKK